MKQVQPKGKDRQTLSGCAFGAEIQHSRGRAAAVQSTASKAKQAGGQGTNRCYRRSASDRSSVSLGVGLAGLDTTHPRDRSAHARWRGPVGLDRRTGGGSGAAFPFPFASLRLARRTDGRGHGGRGAGEAAQAEDGRPAGQARGERLRGGRGCPLLLSLPPLPDPLPIRSHVQEGHRPP